jgi:hypothetical protein
MDSLQRSLAKENFHILGKQMGKEQGRGVCKVCKRRGKRKILKERKNQGEKRIWNLVTIELKFCNKNKVGSISKGLEL